MNSMHELESVSVFGSAQNDLHGRYGFTQSKAAQNLDHSFARGTPFAIVVEKADPWIATDWPHLVKTNFKNASGFRVAKFDAICLRTRHKPDHSRFNPPIVAELVV